MASQFAHNRPRQFFWLGDPEIVVQIISKERQTKYSVSIWLVFARRLYNRLKLQLCKDIPFMRHLQFKTLHRTILRDLKGVLVPETPGKRSKFISFYLCKSMQSISPKISNIPYSKKESWRPYDNCRNVSSPCPTNLGEYFETCLTIITYADTKSFLG